MRKTLHLLTLLAMFAAAPADANFVAEPTFAQKMAEADLVFIGTVTEANRGGRNGFGGTATLVVLTRLKGEAAERVTVSTYSPVAELNPRCCDVGATYLMFVRRSPAGQYVSVWGLYGMTRVGGPGVEIGWLPPAGRR